MVKILQPPHPFAGLKAKHYRAIHFDPPTRFVAGTKGRPQHYPRMTDHEIGALPVQDLAHPEGCFLFFWITSPKIYAPIGSKRLLTSQQIAAQMGFRWSGRFLLWIKTHRSLSSLPPAMFLHRDSFFTGMGYTSRKNAEDCLLFKIGIPRRKSNSVEELMIEPVREHSRKPDETYRRIEEFCHGPYLDIFSREPKPGWDCWGNETNKFARAA